MDLYGYYLEYLKQEAILPFTLRFNRNGKLVGDFYGDKPIIEMINQNERDGVVFDAMVDLEEKIKHLGDNEFVFRISPSGWTGLGYNYTESQSQIYWREGDKIRGLTIRLNAGLGKIIDFLETLGIISSDFSNYLRKLNERESIKEVTSLNLVLNDKLNDFLESLANHFKTDHRGKDLADSILRWQTTEFDFHQYDELTNLINWLEWRLREKGLQSKEELEMILGFVLMTMAGMEMTKQESDKKVFFDNYHYSSKYPFYSDLQYLPFSFYDQVFNHLQSLPGCAGGGIFGREEERDIFGIFEKNRFRLNPFGVQEIDDKNSSDSLKCVTCPFCKKIVDAKIVHKEDGDYIHCPSCNAEVKKN
jgi:ssDNA-binding Zn-finger/Zn-ribbon topoisomerase 1